MPGFLLRKSPDRRVPGLSRSPKGKYRNWREKGRAWGASSKLAEPELVPMMPVGSMSAAGIGDPQGHSIGCRNQLPMAERSPAVS